MAETAATLPLTIVPANEVRAAVTPRLGLRRHRARGRRELRVWPRHRDGEGRRTWYEQHLLPTMDALTRLGLERVLVTHGDQCCRTAPASWQRA